MGTMTAPILGERPHGEQAPHPAVVRLNEVEALVLVILGSSGGDFCFWNFAGLCKETGLDRAKIRRACRSLARKELAVFERGLWTEDGEPAGSGYGATTSGVIRAAFIKATVE